jgi:hypothetical protein
MHPFNLEDLLLPANCIAISIFLITFLAIRNFPLAIVAALIKSGSFIIYFNLYFDGTFTFLDDWTYLERGRILFHQDITIFNLAERWEYVKMIAQGSHVLYYLYNCFSMNLFGDFYFSPVAINLILTGVIAAIGKKVFASHISLTAIQEKIFYFYVLLHPDILAWSTVANLKDILILCLHLVLILATSLLLKNKIIQAALTYLPAIFMLFFSRFYVPVFFSISIMLTIIRNRNFKGKIPIIFISIILSFFVFGWIGSDTFESGAATVDQSYDNPVYGFFRMLLTPIPFHTELAYSFLNCPALFNWLMLPALLRGFYKAVKMNTLYLNFLTTYFVCFLAFYSMYIELQGPRHRVQLDYAIVCFQFIGIMMFLNIPVKEKLPK